MGTAGNFVRTELTEECGQHVVWLLVFSPEGFDRRRLCAHYHRRRQEVLTRVVPVQSDRFRPQ